MPMPNCGNISCADVAMDNSTLVEEVFRNPALWKSDETEYRDKSAKEAAWNIVALSLGCSVEDCYKRWHSLRQKYSVDLKKMKNESYKGMPFVHFDQMDFLRPYVIPRRRAKTKLSQMIADLPQDEFESSAADVPAISPNSGSTASPTLLNVSVKPERPFSDVQNQEDDELSVHTVSSDLPHGSEQPSSSTANEEEGKSGGSSDFFDNEQHVTPGYSAISIVTGGGCDSAEPSSEPPLKVYKGGPAHLPSYLVKRSARLGALDAPAAAPRSSLHVPPTPSASVREATSPGPTPPAFSQFYNIPKHFGQELDELDFFAAQLANQMRRLKPEQQALVKIKFHEVLYNVEFGKK